MKQVDSCNIIPYAARTFECPGEELYIQTGRRRIRVHFPESKVYTEAEVAA
jgi:hypothetical protein